MAVEVFNQGEMRDRLGWMFNVYDIDNDGHIQYAELKKLIEVSL